MKYDAFISYRHLDTDMFVAKGIHRALETSRIPRKIQKETGKKRINRVFRDQEELPIGSDLGSNIEMALADSEYLIVICTPATKESYWVMKEIDTFIATHGRENILAVLADGEPVDSFPPQICRDDFGNPVEPLAADVRGSSKSEIQKKIKSESLRLVAAILGCDYDNLKQRHKERVIKRYMAIAAGVAALSVAFGIYNAYNLRRISENYQKMLIKESKVLAEKSIDALEQGDRETAGLLAIEGLPVNGKDRPLVSDCIYALEKANNSFDQGQMAVHDKILRHDQPLRDFKVNNDGSRLVSIDDDYGVYWWDLKNGKRILKRNSEYIENEQEYVCAVGENNGRMIVVSRKFILAFDENGNIVYEVQFGDNYCEDAYIDDGNKYAVVAKSATFGDGALEVYDLSDGSLVKRFEHKGEKVFSVSPAHFNDDYSLLMVHEWQYDSEDPTVLCILNMETGARMEFDIKEKSVADNIFTADSNIAVASLSSGYELQADPIKLYVQKFDLKTGKEIFCKDFDVNKTVYGYYMFVDITLNSRIYQGENGQEKDLVVTANTNLFNIDLDTGETKLKYVAATDIKRVSLISDSDLVMVGTFDGNVIHISSVDGSPTQSITYFTSKEMEDYFIGRGHIISRDLSTPNIVVMSLLPDPSKVDYADFDGSVYYVASSPSGKTFVAAAYDGFIDGTWGIHVYDSETKQELANISYDDISFDHAFYKDEDTIVIFRESMKIYQYTISTGEVEDITFKDEEDYPKMVIGKNNRYLLYYFSRNYYVVDLVSNTVVYHYEDEGGDHYLSGGILVADGRKVIGQGMNDEIVGLNIGNGKWTEFFNGYHTRGFGVSPDGAYIAASCTDGYMRIYSVEKDKIIHEFGFYGDDYGCFIDFSEDNKLLFLQGKDLLFKVYDLEKGDFIYISDDQIDEVSHIDYDKESNTATITGDKNLYILDVADRGFLHNVPSGKVYIPEKNEVLCYDRGQVFKYNIRSMNELVDLFYEQFEGAELTDEQRVKYNLY
jgi:WD40 repeat protein